jgi:hypothetical protein
MRKRFSYIHFPLELGPACRKPNSELEVENRRSLGYVLKRLS